MENQFKNFKQKQIPKIN